jgi:ABC-type phosphate/phosphonate transport system ATPase subunit
MDDFTRINKMGITIIANMHHVDLSQENIQLVSLASKLGRSSSMGNQDEVTDEVTFDIYGRSSKQQ